MELLKYTVVKSERFNLDLIDPFERLHTLLEQSLQKWMSSDRSKTADTAIQCQSGD